MIDDATAADVLNELLRAEYRSHLYRLGDMAPHVSWPTVVQADLIDRAVGRVREHADRLAQAVLDLRHSPAPRTLDLATASAHYCDVPSVLPQLVAEKRRLVSLYEGAVARLAGHPAGDVVASLLAGHRDHLAELAP